MENTHRRPSGKRPKKRRFRGNQFMKVSSHTYVAERKDTSKCASNNKISGIQTSLKSNLVKSLPKPVEQNHMMLLIINFHVFMKEVAEEIMKRAAVEENSSSPDNLNGPETGKVLDREVLSSFCKVCDSYKGVKFGIKYNKWQRAHKISCRKNYSGSVGKMEVDGMLRIFNRSEKLHNLKYSNYIGDGDTKTFNALSENKPYGDDHLIQKIECVGHVQKRMGTRLRKLKLVYSKNKLSDGKTIGGKGRLTDSLIDKLAHYYGNAIRCNSTSVKEMRKAIWAVWGHSCSTDDEPMHWFCPTNPNTWCKYNAAINNNLQNYKHKPSVVKAVRDVIKPVFADLSHPALLKKCLGGKTQNPNESLNSLIWKFCPKTIGSSLQIAEIAVNLATSVFNDGNQILISILKKFGLKINRNVCVSLAERDNRRIFTSRQRRLESSFEARRAKKIKKVKKLSCLRNRKVYHMILEHFSVEGLCKRNMPGKRARGHFSQLSEFERGLIIGMKTAGWSTRRVAGQVDRLECAVRNCWEQWTGEDPTVTRLTIRADVGVAIVPQTISRHLAEANLKSKHPFHALSLTPEHRQLRLQWSQAISMWNVTYLKKVVFSDGSRFVLGTDDNRVRVWRHPGERYNSPHTALRHTAPTADVMVWAP
ncbi:uncharacterized protein TNCV_553201 [Trichonephila clavipes]|nr:uncharacterized protein TNCV_553201 [Trichonephila clavipes]